MFAISKRYKKTRKRSFVDEMRCVTHQNTVGACIESVRHSPATTQIAPLVCVADTDRHPK
jgi:hypothetical protein